MDRVDVAEIEDGREQLAVTRQRYDLVLSEPSSPRRSGVASLYSQDFYRSVSDKLTDDGALGQWLQPDEVDPQAMQVVLATMSTVFPHITVWQLGPGHMMIVATKKPQSWDMSKLRALADTEPYRTALPSLFGVTGAEGMLALQLASEPMVQSLAAPQRGDVSSDDMPRLEFMFARSLGRRTDDVRLELYALARGLGLGQTRPVVTGDVDWHKVDEQRARPFVWRNGVAPGPISSALPLAAFGATTASAAPRFAVAD
jgi:spermidine synthase